MKFKPGDIIQNTTYPGEYDKYVVKTTRVYVLHYTYSSEQMYNESSMYIDAHNDMVTDLFREPCAKI